MKQFVTIILPALLLCSQAFAQTAESGRDLDKEGYATEVITSEVEGNRYQAGSFRDNWFISAGAGFSSYFGDHNRQLYFKDLISPVAEFSVGKWLTPSVGLRASYNGFIIRGATQTGAYAVIENGSPKPVSYRQSDGKGVGWWLYHQKFPYLNVHADVMLDMCNLIGGYRADRIYHAVPYVGLGVAHSWQTKDTKKWREQLRASGEELKTLDKNKEIVTEDNETSLSGVLGFLSTFYITDYLDLFLDVRGTMVKDAFDMEYARIGRSGEGPLSLSVGLTYKFNPRGFTRTKHSYRDITGTTDISGLQDRISEQQARRDSLRQEYAVAKGVAPKIIVDTVTVDVDVYQASRTTVMFQGTSTRLSGDARVNIGLFSQLVRRFGADQVYVITGYYEKGKGNSDVMEITARKRAQVVKDCLVNEFAIPERQLEIATSSDVDFSEDPELRRCVVIGAR